ncbi:hypothetical protein HZA99_02440 [Candidatus Woesearchaeota archaeon]|nr:hypothetical protein [Candidatus Woesearchaeota archaeon]
MKAKKLTAILPLLTLLSDSGVQNSQDASQPATPVVQQNTHFAADTEILWPYTASPAFSSQLYVSPSFPIPTQENITIDALLNVRNSAQEPLFLTADEAAIYAAHNGTLSDAHLYAEVTTLSGTPVRRTNKGGLSLFAAENGRLEEALSLLAVSVPDAAGEQDSVFQTWEDLALYKFVGGTPEYAAQLASFRNRNETAPFSSAQDYIYAAYANADMKTLTALHELKDNDDAEIFTTARDLLPVAVNTTNNPLRITPDKIAQLRKIKTLSGKYLFATVDDFFAAAGTDVSYNEIQNLAVVPTDTGDSLFTAGAAIQYAAAKKGDGYLDKLLAIENAESTRIFTDGASVAAYAAMNGIPEIAQQLADLLDEQKNPFLLPYEAIRYAALGFTEKDFIPLETKKPNALVFFGILDYNQAFLNGVMRDHLKEIRAAYDLRLEFIQEDTAPEKEYATLKEYSLLVLAGHGDGELHRIRLGEGTEESAYLDQTDTGFCKLLDTLPPDAHIFLFSCYAGIGGEKGDNFANYAASCAPGRTVISSTTIINAGAITVETEYPFTARINAAERFPYNMDPRQKYNTDPQQNKGQVRDATYTVVKSRTASASDLAQAPAAVIR